MGTRYTIKGVLAGAKRRLVRPLLAYRARALHQRSIDALLAGDKRVNRLLFVCYGNICRSPLAEKLALAQSNLLVESAGFFQTAGRSSPDNMQFAARQLGTELANWKSSLITLERIRDADLVILFDLHNFAYYKRAFGTHHPKILMLGLLAEPSVLEISDPYGRGEEEALRVGRQIEAAVRKLIALTESSAQNRHRK